MKFFHNNRFLLSFAAFAVVTLLTGALSINGVRAKDSSEGDIVKELKLFTDVLSLVQRDYVREVDGRALVEGAVKGMLTTLDPHSGYLDPDFYQDLQVQTKGEFGGLGIEITVREGMLVVVAPMDGSPAEKAGIRAGDAIVKIENKFTKDYTLVDAVKKLRGPKGTPVVLSIYRKGQTDLFDVTVYRDNIQVRSVRSRYLGGGYGYIRINQFMEKTTDAMNAALKAMKAKSDDGELHGLILDLRNNPGGLLNQAVMVADRFLKEGVIVYTDGRIEAQKQKFFAHSRGTEPEYPLIVLVNGGSASAAEIVAGAFKDHGRAMVIGTQSFGKGSVQTISPLENGGAVTLTTALYYTKSGNSIQARGVKPDIEVAEEEEQPTAAAPKVEKKKLNLREEDLPGAIVNPDEKRKSEEIQIEGLPDGALQRINQTPDIDSAVNVINPETTDLAIWLEKDKPMQRAYDLIRSYNIFKVPEKTEEGEPGPAT